MAHHFLVEAEKQYALALGRLQTVEIATETVVGAKAMERADQRVQAEKKAIQAKLESIQLNIRLLYDPEWTPDHVKPLVPRRPPRRKGEIAKMGYRALKRSNAPLSAWEIADLIADDVGVDATDRRSVAKLADGVAMSLNRRTKEGMVERVEGKPIRWRAPRRQWVRPNTRVAFASVPLAAAGAASPDTKPAASANSQPSRRPAEA